jgi:hypothetical protein
LFEEGGRDVGEPLVGNLQEKPVLVTAAASIDIGPSEGFELTQPIAGALIGEATGLLDVAPGKLPVGTHPRAFRWIEAEREMDQSQNAPKRRVAQLWHLREDRIRDGDAEEARRERLGGVQRQLTRGRLVFGQLPGGTGGIPARIGRVLGRIGALR